MTKFRYKYIIFLNYINGVIVINISKHERFVKVISSRLEKHRELMRLIGNCSNKNNYSYTSEETAYVFEEIEKDIDTAKRQYGIVDDNMRLKDFKSSFESGMTWVSGFMQNVYKYGEKTAFICPMSGESMTYSQLNRAANKYANALSAVLNKSGGKVMYCYRNSPEFMCIYIACQKIGAIGCPVSFYDSPRDIAGVIGEAKPDVFIYEYSGGTELALNIARYKPGVLLVSGYPKDKKLLEGHMRTEELTEDAVESEPNGEYGIYAETTHFYTSGTTGKPKCAPVTSINEVMSAREVMTSLGLSSEDITMNTTPWHHRGGLHCCGPAAALYAGATSIIMRDFKAEECLEYIERYRVTLASAIPVTLYGMAHAQAGCNRNLASLRGIITMGSPMTASGNEGLLRILGSRIYNVYGTTETFFNTMLTPEDIPYMSGTVGRACAGDDVRIVKLSEKGNCEPDEVVPHDGKEVGEIIIKATGKSAGFYYNDSEETERKFKNGYLYTGDLGCWDEKGYITVLGRRDDMIICCGEKIYPINIEEALMSNPKVLDCIVTSVPDSGMGEAIVAYVVKKDDSLTAEELNTFCIENLMTAVYSRPVYYRFKKVLPRNAAGKKLHNRAKREAAADFKKGRLQRVLN